MEKKFRLATTGDLEDVIILFRQAVSDMIARDILQWDDIYPNSEILAGDIRKSQMYVLTDGQAIVSAVVLNSEQEKGYEQGDWNYHGEDIAVVHRLCVHPEHQNKGIGREIMRYAEEILREAGYRSIRLDAFRENPHALRFYQRLGYRDVGRVTFRKGENILFEKIFD